MMRRFLMLMMFGVAAVIIARLTILHRPPATKNLWLDLAFAAFFLIRGLMHLKSLRKTAVAKQ